MKIIFSHGQESTPFGTKIQTLSKIAKDMGFETDSIDYRSIPNPDDRVTHLESYLKNENPEDIILVGSSMGGYVSTVASCNLNIKGLFLLAPALYLKPDMYNVQEYLIGNTHCEIVHGYEDDIIPYENSVRFGFFSKNTVNLIEGDHRLNTSLETVGEIFKTFLKNFKKI